MNRIIFSVIVFLCITAGYAQEKISKEDFNYLIDYANCKYVKTFIEKKFVGKPYYSDTYEKKIKPFLEKVTLEDFKTILSYEELRQKLGKNDLASRLVDTINARKTYYEKASSDEDLIEQLKATKWSKVDLISTAESVLKSVYKKYNISRDISAQEMFQEQATETSNQVEELSSKVDQLQQQNNKSQNDIQISEYQTSLKNFKIIVYSIMGILFVLIILMYFLIKGNLREHVIKYVLESQRIEEKFTKSNQKENSLKEHDYNIIIDRILKHLPQNIKEPPPQQTINTVFDTPKKSVAKYLKGKSGNMFSRLETTPENSFFKLLYEYDDSADFEFFGDEKEALAKRIFSNDICTIISGNYQNANSVITYKPGKVVHNGEQWEVIEPILIKLV